MKAITKKRTKAFFIDLAVSTAVTAGVECLLRKKVKKEAIHALLTPTLVMWTLEYAQLRKTGQTIGYKQLGLTLEGEHGAKLTRRQLIKRMAYRDTVSSFSYLGNRQAFEKNEGKQLPHDFYAGTIVKEV
ncbi:RDD family protein [Virgibacillus sp. W0430]|uniref:RDD family protein n=1 Tax=Virgibacillus sp. W0430 TaxID=3391580 RepID=UPI003F44639F